MAVSKYVIIFLALSSANAGRDIDCRRINGPVKVCIKW